MCSSVLNMCLLACWRYLVLSAGVAVFCGTFLKEGKLKFTEFEAQKGPLDFYSLTSFILLKFNLILCINTLVQRSAMLSGGKDTGDALE